MGVYINKNRSANRVDGAAGPASSIGYNNTESGLNAENVQGAIDEVQGEVTELNSNFSLYYKITAPDTIAQGIPSTAKEILLDVTYGNLGIHCITKFPRWIITNINNLVYVDTPGGFATFGYSDTNMICDNLPTNYIIKVYIR